MLLTLALVVTTAAVGAYWYVRPLLLTATGYAAHNACALEHIADRTDPASDLPPNPLVPYLRTSSSDDGSVRASVLGLLAAQTAWYTEGHGCALADERPAFPAATPITDAHPLIDAPAPTSTPEGVEAAIDAAFAEGLGTRAIVVVKDGELVAERYADGFTAETPQLGWSMSKSVANLLVGRLVEENGFDIRASDLRQEWTGEHSTITADHLMRMTAGLAWDETYDLGTPITAMLYLTEDMGDYVASQPLAHPVGDFQQYSTGSTNLLCEVASEAVDGDANLARELLLEPLGLPSAQWELDASGTPVCGSYLWATPREWAAIGQFVLDDGVVSGARLLPEGWVAGATEPTVADELIPTPYGAGWWLNRDVDGDVALPGFPADGFWAQGHDGQRLYIVPSEGLVVVRMGFSPGLDDTGIGSAELMTGILDSLVG